MHSGGVTKWLPRSLFNVGECGAVVECEDVEGVGAASLIEFLLLW